MCLCFPGCVERAAFHSNRKSQRGFRDVRFSVAIPHSPKLFNKKRVRFYGVNMDARVKLQAERALCTLVVLELDEIMRDTFARKDAETCEGT